jgi:hypothetical protein
MTARTKRLCCLAAIAVLVALGLALLAFSKPDPPDSILLSLMIGTFFGQTALAAGWCALGPYTLARRLMLSSIWLAAIIIGFGGNSEPFGPPDLNPLMTFSLVVVAEWTLVGVSLWAVASLLNIRIAGDSIERRMAGHDWQIGLREVMVVTAVIATVFGVARWKYGLDGLKINWRALSAFGLLTLTASVVAILPMVYLLFVRNSFRLVAGTIVLLAIASSLHISLLTFVWRRGVVDWELGSAIFVMDLTQSAWAGGVAALLYLGGFRIVRGHGSSGPDMATEQPGLVPE